MIPEEQARAMLDTELAADGYQFGSLGPYKVSQDRKYHVPPEPVPAYALRALTRMRRQAMEEFLALAWSRAKADGEVRVELLEKAVRGAIDG